MAKQQHWPNAGTYLCEILADRFGGSTEIVAKRTGISGLTGTLAVELARNVRCIWEEKIRSAKKGDAKT